MPSLRSLCATPSWDWAAAVLSPAAAQERFIVMPSTTSTEQPVIRALLPLFKQATGIDVRVVAVGTGQALDMARRGDADVVFVHDQAAEEKFVADGFSLERRPVMYNDFVLVGPKNDPPRTRGRDIAAGLQKLAVTKGSGFISRGDKSGTHAAELRHWQAAGVDVAAAKPAGYRSAAVAWAGLEHGQLHGGLCTVRPRHLAELQEPGASWPSWWKATAACSTSTA